MCYAACDTISRGTSTLSCRICTQHSSKQPSKLEKELYTILNQHTGIQAFAVEAHAMQGTHEWEGGGAAAGEAEVGCLVGAAKWGVDCSARLSALQ